MLKPAEQPAHRRKAKLDGPELFAQVPGPVWCNLHARLPPLLAPRLDRLDDGASVVREEPCLEEDKRIRSRLPARAGNLPKRERGFTFEHLLDHLIALRQILLPVEPVRALGLEFGLEELLPVLQLPDLLRVPGGLVGQRLLQPLALRGRLAALQLLGLKLALKLSHTVLQLRGGLYENKEESSATVQTKTRSRQEDPARLLSSRPESRGLHPVGALARPH
jgi:hypothetical protein